MTRTASFTTSHTVRAEVTTVRRIRRHRRATACAGSAIDHDVHSGVETCHTCGREI